MSLTTGALLPKAAYTEDLSGSFTVLGFWIFCKIQISNDRNWAKISEHCAFGTFLFRSFHCLCEEQPCKTVFLLLFNYFWLGVFVFFQIPGAPDDEAVRIFLEFERVESAIKGRILNCIL